MVNFNNENTISTPATDVMRILILERRANVIEAIEHYIKLRNNGTDIADLEILKARLFTMYLEVSAMLNNHLKPEEYAELQEQIGSDSFKDLVQAFHKIDGVLYDITLTKIDSKRNIDWSNIEATNKAYGYY